MRYKKVILSETSRVSHRLEYAIVRKKTGEIIAVFRYEEDADKFLQERELNASQSQPHEAHIQPTWDNY